jgi:hypothetical protein
LAFRGRWQGIDLGVYYELEPHRFYMRKRVEITNNRKSRVFLAALHLESLWNQLANKQMADVAPSAFYSKRVSRSAECFTLMEFPAGIASLFDMKHFPGRFLQPGEHYVSYPGVVGMTAKGNLDFELPDKTRFPEGPEGFMKETQIAGLKLGYYLRTSALVMGRKAWTMRVPGLPDTVPEKDLDAPGHYRGNEGGVSCFGCREYEEYFGELERVSLCREQRVCRPRGDDAPGRIHRRR